MRQSSNSGGQEMTGFGRGRAWPGSRMLGGGVGWGEGVLGARNRRGAGGDGRRSSGGCLCLAHTSSPPVDLLPLTLIRPIQARGEVPPTPSCSPSFSPFAPNATTAGTPRCHRAGHGCVRQRKVAGGSDMLAPHVRSTFTSSQLDTIEI